MIFQVMLLMHSNKERDNIGPWLKILIMFCFNVVGVLGTCNTFMNQFIIILRAMDNFKIFPRLGINKL